MMTFKDSKKLSQMILGAYKSLDKPDFSFVRKSVSSRPYEGLVKSIAQRFEVEEITDSNDDVSFRYFLSRFNRRWVMELSMLGRYAAVFEVPEYGIAKVVSPNSSDREEQEILSLLREGQFVVLDKKVLEAPFPLRLFNTEYQNSCIYQALFSDVDILPWRDNSSQSE